jgi:uncharacterized protein (DUF1015 family)
VDISPFKATILNPELEKRAELVCPVYDTIDAHQYERYAAEEHNVIHITTRKEGTPEQDFIKYASTNLERFFKDGILREREKPAFYIYGVRYQLSEELLEQIPAEARRETYFAFGLVALVKVDELTGETIVGHEKVFAAKTQERYHLMRASGMNFSPIVAEYSMPDHALNRLFEEYLGFRRPDLQLDTRRMPLVDVELNGTRHLLWEVSDVHMIARIQGLMREKRLLILDGHHRYTASCQLSRGGQQGTAYTLMMLMEGGDRALLLLPWHRCVKRCRVEELWRRIEEYFTVVPYAKREGNALVHAQLNQSPTAEFDVRFGMYDGDRYYVLRADEPRIKRLAAERGERVGLDVISLHEWLIEPTLMGNPEDEVVFTASPRDAIAKVDKEAYAAAFFLKPLRIAEVEYKAHVEKRAFPQKSTLFLPKVAEGIVMWKWR